MTHPSSPDEQIFTEIRSIYDASILKDPGNSHEYDRDARALAERAGGKHLGNNYGENVGLQLFRLMPDILKQAELLDAERLLDVEEISTPPCSEISATTHAYSIAAKSLGTTLFAKFNDTPLIAHPDVSYTDTLVDYHTMRSEYQQKRREVQAGQP